MRIILGSTSKWRREIASQALGCEVETCAADIDERAVTEGKTGISIIDYPSLIAQAKLAKLMGEHTGNPAIYMCFDTIVVYRNQILNKPKDKEDLIRMVKMWASIGEKTEVYTAISVGRTDNNKIVNVVERSDVIMTRTLTETEFDNYTNGKYVAASSGALIVEDLQEINAATIEGELSTIQGFPITKTKEIVNNLIQ